MFDDRASLPIRAVEHTHGQLRCSQPSPRAACRRDVGAKKVSKLLERFQDQKHFARAMELLGPDWKAVTAQMSPEEIVGRFVALTAPEIFEEREKEKPFVQPHAPKPHAQPGHKTYPPKAHYTKTHGKHNSHPYKPRA